MTMIAVFCFSAISGLSVKPSQAKPVSTNAAPYSNLGKNIDDVRLIDVNGRAVRWRDLKGAPRALFFGFTMCPEICPTTVSTLDAARENMSTPSHDVKVDFVTLDPERDHPAALKAYFKAFTHPVRAYSGTAKDTAKLAVAFRVSYRRVDLGGDDYTLDHTAAIYLIDRYGTVVDVIPYGASPKSIAARLDRLVASNAR